MSDLRELYQTTILDHNKHPRNFGELPDANKKAHGDNPLCGDKITIFVDVDRDLVKAVRFHGSGCAISKASASMMTEQIEGKSLIEANELFLSFHEMVTSDPIQPVDTSDLGKLSVFAGVREFPMRIKCATLCWHTFKAAVNNQTETVKTEE